MSLKLWFILFSVRELLKFIDKQTPPTDANNPATILTKFCKLFARHLLQMQPVDAVRPIEEKHLRTSVQSFPYKQSLLYQTLMKSLKGIEFGQLPSAYNLICESLFGHRYVKTGLFCWTCGVATARKRCNGCKVG